MPTTNLTSNLPPARTTLPSTPKTQTAAWAFSRPTATQQPTAPLLRPNPTNSHSNTWTQIPSNTARRRLKSSTRFQRTNSTVLILRKGRKMQEACSRRKTRILATSLPRATKGLLHFRLEHNLGWLKSHQKPLRFQSPSSNRLRLWVLSAP